MTSPICMTAALKPRAIPLTAASVFQMMLWAKPVEDVEYVASSGSGKIKHYLRSTDCGSAYVVYLPEPVSKEQTEVAIYPSRLGPVMRQCHSAFGHFIELNVA